MSITPSTNFLPLATKLIGCSYVHGGRSPDGFDCWGLLWYFYKQMGRDIMEPGDYSLRTTFAQKSETSNELIKSYCRELTAPEDYCIVSFSRNGLAIHCGIWLNENEGCLHATEFGVVCEKISTIKQIRNLDAKYFSWQ